MSEYNHLVQKQADILAAEEWGKIIKSLHVHSMNSMWYDDRPEDTEEGMMVTDTEYNSGIIERSKNGNIIHVFGEKLKGDDLLDSFYKGGG